MYPAKRCALDATEFMTPEALSHALSALVRAARVAWYGLAVQLERLAVTIGVRIPCRGCHACSGPTIRIDAVVTAYKLNLQ